MIRSKSDRNENEQMHDAPSKREYFFLLFYKHIFHEKHEYFWDTVFFYVTLCAFRLKVCAELQQIFLETL